MSTERIEAASTLAGIQEAEVANRRGATRDGCESKVACRENRTGRGRNNQPVFPVEPRVIQVVKKPRTFMNHSYRDFSSVPPEPHEEIPTDISQMTFPQKVHHMLSQPAYSRYIAWQPHGRSFSVIIPKMFETEVCQKYLGHKRYSSFLRQLSNHSFKHITEGNDRNCYYHEFMLRGLPHLCKYMPRAKDARRLVPDPANEPDFYAISKAYPIAGGPEENEAEKKQPMGKARPTQVVGLPQAGTPRLASELAQMKDATMPVAKRCRTSLAQPLLPAQPVQQPSIQQKSPPVQQTLLAHQRLQVEGAQASAHMLQAVQQPPNQQRLPPGQQSPAQRTLSQIQQPSAKVGAVSSFGDPNPGASSLAASLLAAFNGNGGISLSTPAAPAPVTMTQAPTHIQPPPLTDALSVETNWCGQRPPRAQTRAVVDENAVLLEAIKAGLGSSTQTPSPTAQTPIAPPTQQQMGPNDALMGAIRLAFNVAASAPQPPPPAPSAPNAVEPLVNLASRLIQQVANNEGGSNSGEINNALTSLTIAALLTTGNGDR